MKHQLNAVIILLLLTFLLLAGCSGSSSNQTGNLSYATAMNGDAADKLLNGMDSGTPNGFTSTQTNAFLSVKDGMAPGLKYDVSPFKIRYPYSDVQGKEHSLSGMLAFPRGEKGSVVKAPILLYNHGTILTRKEAPSHIIDHNEGHAESLIGLLFARAGYIVAMADYPGLGDDVAMHPYMHNDSVVKSVLGMFEAAKSCTAGTISGCKDVPAGVAWDGRIFIMGYSQGGAVTLGTARELQNRGVKIEAAAAMASPCDLSGAMRDKMLENSESKAPFFLPYVILGYRDVYDRLSDGSYDQNGTFEPVKVFRDSYASVVPPLFDGIKDSKTVNSYLPKVPRTLMTQSLIDDLEKPESKVMKSLSANNTYEWVPTMPLLLTHHPKDDLVPYKNSVTAYNYFTGKQSKKIQFYDLYYTIDLGSVHASAAPTAFIMAYGWLNQYK